MSDARTFLTRVLPWPSEEGHGFTNVHYLKKTGGLPGECVRDAAHMLLRAAELQDRYDVYFCTTRQSVNAGTRLQENAVAVKALWFDLDYKVGDPKKYQTIEEALERFQAFLKHYGLPQPNAVVQTGNGYHVYWISDRELTAAEWRRYANGMWTLAKEFGLKFDPVTQDGARVLRIPGTWNHKSNPPRPVVLEYLDDADFNFQTTFAQVWARGRDPFVEYAKEAPIRVGKISSKFKSVTVEPLGRTPVTIDEVGATCPWIGDALKTGGAGVSYAEWYQMVYLATFVEDGHEAAHRLSEGYEKFNEREFEKKWREAEKAAFGKGPPSCQTISGCGASTCGSCPLFKLGRGPVALARDAAEGDNLGPFVVPEKPVPVREQNSPTADEDDQKLPDGYRENPKTGKVGYLKMVKGPEGEKIEVLHPMLKQRVKNFRNTKTGLEFATMVCKDTWEDVCLPHVKLSAATIGMALLEARILFDPETPTAKLSGFFMSFLEKLNDAKTAQDPITYGWHHKGKTLDAYVYGGKMYDVDSSAVKFVPVQRGIHDYYMPVGDIESWYEAAKTVTDQKRPELNLILAIPFAAPIMEVSGESGGLISAWGPPGTTKSSASKVAAAVWGHPKQTRESLDSTANSVLHRLGSIRNIPAYWDDIQRIEGQKHLWKTGFVTTQGIEKGRMTSDIKQQNRGMWRTLLLACSNMSFREYVVKESPDTSASLLRLLEYKVLKKEDHMIDDTRAGQIIADLEYNYGRIGEKYAQLLADQAPMLKEFFTSTVERFKARVEAQKDERVWSIMCGALIVGATFAKKLDVDIDVKQLEEFLVEVFLENRRHRNAEGTDAGTAVNTEIMLQGFLKKYSAEGHAVWTDTSAQSGQRRGAVKLMHRMPENNNRQIHVQFIVQDRLVRFSRREFRKYLDEQKSAAGAVIDGLRNSFMASEKQFRLAGGTAYAIPPEWCIEIPVTAGGPLDELLLRYGTGNGGERL